MNFLRNLQGLASKPDQTLTPTDGAVIALTKGLRHVKINASATTTGHTVIRPAVGQHADGMILLVEGEGTGVKLMRTTAGSINADGQMLLGDIDRTVAADDILCLRLSKRGNYWVWKELSYTDVTFDSTPD